MIPVIMEDGKLAEMQALLGADALGFKKALNDPDVKAKKFKVGRTPPRETPPLSELDTLEGLGGEYVTRPEYDSPIRILKEIEEKISAEEVGEAWPLTLSTAILKVLRFNYRDGELEYGPCTALLVEDMDGMIYAASESAEELMEQTGWEPLTLISLTPTLSLDERTDPLFVQAAKMIHAAGWEMGDGPQIQASPLN